MNKECDICKCETIDKIEDDHFKKIEELEDKIESMKCCGNCTYYQKSHLDDSMMCKTIGINPKYSDTCGLWALLDFEGIED